MLFTNRHLQYFVCLIFFTKIVCCRVFDPEIETADFFESRFDNDASDSIRPARGLT